MAALARVAEEEVPLCDGAVAGDDDGAAAVALADDVVEILGLFVAQGAQAEVVDDEEVRGGIAQEAAREAVVGAGGAQVREELGGGSEEGGEAVAAGAAADGLGDVCLAGASASHLRRDPPLGGRALRAGR